MPTLRAGAPNGGAGHGARSGDSKDEYIVPVVQASVAVAYALQDVRDVQKAQNGRGWNDEGVSYTVDTAATQGVAYSTKLHNTAGNQAGKFYTEYTTALDRSSPPPAVIAPVAIGAMKHPAASGGVSGAKTAKCGIATRLALHRLQVPPQGAGNLPTAIKGGQGSAAGGIGWDAHVSPTLGSADSGSNRAPVVLTGESEVVGALACNTGPNGHDAGNFACNQAVDAGHVLPVVAPPAFQVRRLTPVECERLMGFPDSYTMISWRKKPADQCPDGVRYKALGNSWAVPVVSWIGRRIAEAL